VLTAQYRLRISPGPSASSTIPPLPFPGTRAIFRESPCRCDPFPLASALAKSQAMAVRNCYLPFLLSPEPVPSSKPETASPSRPSSQAARSSLPLPNISILSPAQNPRESRVCSPAASSHSISRRSSELFHPRHNLENHEP